MKSFVKSESQSINPMVEAREVKVRASYSYFNAIVGKDESGVSAGELGGRHFDGLRDCLA